jgi:protease I
MQTTVTPTGVQHKALILVADGFEDLELFCPWYRLREEGVDVILATPTGRTVKGKHGYVVDADVPIREVDPAGYDLLLIPGGRSPEALRLRDEAVDVTRTFVEEEKRIAAICHGPQLLLSAGALTGRAITCAPAIRDDVRAAGASYRDEAVVVDGHILTGRGPDDLPQFCRHLVAMVHAPA